MDTMQVWEVVRDMTQPTKRSPRLDARGRPVYVPSIPQIAHFCRVSPVTVYKWGQPDVSSKFPAELISPLRHFLDDTLLIESLAIQCGGTFVANPETPATAACVAKLSKEFSDLVGAWSDQSTHSRIQHEGRELIAATLSLMAQFAPESNHVG